MENQCNIYNEKVNYALFFANIARYCCLQITVHWKFACYSDHSLVKNKSIKSFHYALFCACLTCPHQSLCLDIYSSCLLHNILYGQPASSLPFISSGHLGTFNTSQYFVWTARLFFFIWTVWLLAYTTELVGRLGHWFTTLFLLPWSWWPEKVKVGHIVNFFYILPQFTSIPSLVHVMIHFMPQGHSKKWVHEFAPVAMILATLKIGWE